MVDMPRPAADRPVPGTGMEQLQQEFETILRQESGLDPESCEELGQMFQQALEDAAASPDPGAMPDRASWMQAVEALQRSGDVDGDEVNDLIRRLNEALEPLERRESRLAIEFSRKMAAEGEAAALAWLRQQTDREKEDKAQEPAPFPRNDHPSLRDEVVNSRSRRLRGPPRNA
ncbi:hypothetical protein H0E84_10395 [Luteimonas sp. SJ-92]|uniref:Uncharacterized protein n=1 Tax=Luteimonas salinisoli TaxID=2752307 RepID=A0A853JC24_9GAMM|nr:hypothetical protein [Luteimonas salinisoli]NZA26793.1 hypothetical protein [Luteimonas salinisoli]